MPKNTRNKKNTGTTQLVAADRIKALKEREKSIAKELKFLKEKVKASIFGDVKEDIKRKTVELMKVRELISHYESREFSRKTKKLKLDKLLATKEIKKFLASSRSLSLAKKTSFYYALRKNYLFNPYKTPEEIFSSYSNRIKALFFGKLLNKYGSIRDIERRNPILSRLKDFVNTVNIANLGKAGFGFLNRVVDKSIEKWFPGKFGSTPRLIKAWIKRKMLYGESGISNRGVKRLSYGGYERVRKLGATFSSASYLSKRRKIRTIRRGFRKGGGYRRFA